MGNFPFTPLLTDYCSGTYDFSFYGKSGSTTIPQNYGWNGIVNPAYFNTTFPGKVKFKKMTYNSFFNKWISVGILGNEFPTSGPFSGANYFAAVIHYYTND